MTPGNCLRENEKKWKKVNNEEKYLKEQNQYWHQ